MVGTTLILGIIAITLSICVSAAFLLWGARIAGIAERTFGKALGTIVLGGIASGVISLLLKESPVLGASTGIIGGFLISAVVMMAIFSTTFGKALGATVIAWILSILVVGGIILAGLVLFGGMALLSV